MNADGRSEQLTEQVLFGDIAGKRRDVATRGGHLTTETTEGTLDMAPGVTDDPNSPKTFEPATEHIEEDANQPNANFDDQPRIFMRLSRPKLQKAASSSLEEHCYHKPDKLAGLPQKIAPQASKSIKCPKKSEQILATGEKSNIPAVEYPSDDSDQGSQSEGAFTRPKKREHDLQLKTCFKWTARGASVTPPSTSDDKGRADKSVDFARVVDFEKSLPAVSVLPAMVWETNKSLSNRDGASPACPGSERRERAMEGIIPYDVAVGTSSPAVPALTRTNVHVIATVPSHSMRESSDEAAIDTATPTMQIVDSTSSRYKVMWDDIPPESTVQQRRGSSPENPHSETLDSTAMRDLQRVQLEDGSRERRGSLSQCFTPNLVVFPDKDSQKIHPERHEVFLLSGDINRHDTPTRPSSCPSESMDKPLKKEISDDNFNIEKEPSELVPVDHFLGRVTTSQRIQQLVSARKLSNVEDSTRFCNHRDSLALARARLLRSDGMLSERIMH